MKNILKGLVLAAVVLVLVSPHSVEASWWNPFSWFKKDKAVPAVVVPPTSTTTNKPTPVVVTPTTTPVKSNPLPPVGVPVGKPTSTKPVSNPPKATSTKPTSTTTKATSTKSEVNGSSTTAVQVEIPTFVLNDGFTPAGFVSPRDVRNGTTLLTIEAQSGKVQAIGTWYVDSITWKVVSDSYRSGDLTISVLSGQKNYGDSSVINETHVTKLSSHVVSSPISFVINGQTPRKGQVRIVVEGIRGHTSTNASVEYALGGTPLTGPDFSISSN